MEIKTIADVLQQSFPSIQQIKDAKAHSILKNWVDIIGPRLGQKSSPQSFKAGTLIVHTQGSAWTQEMQMEKQQILKSLNERAGENLFKDLRFSGPKKKSKLAELNNDPTARVST